MAGLVRLELDALQQPLVCEETRIAWRYLRGTHASVTGLFDALHIVRLAKQAASGSDSRGKLSNDEQDLLRAALVFTSAGLDACFKQLVRGALKTTIEHSAAADKEFRRFVNDRLDAHVVSKEMREAITGTNPRSRLIDLYLLVKSAPSLQSPADLVNVRKALGMSGPLHPDRRFEQLDSFFAARNEIVHELDFKLSVGPGDPGRRQRQMRLVRDQCNDVIELLSLFLGQTARHIRRMKSRKATRD